MNNKKIIVASICFISCFVLLGCTSTNPSKKVNDEGNVNNSSGKRTIKIGAIAPLSGPASTYGQDALNAYNDAMNNYSNDTVDVQLIVEDGKCEGKDSVSAIQKLITIDKVDFILGGLCSGETVAAGKIAQQQEVLMLSPTASSPEISGLGEYIFRFWNDAHASIGLAKYLHTHHEKIAIIYENTDYAKALADKLKEEYTGVVTADISFDSNEKDFLILSKEIEKKKESIDGVLMITQSESTMIGLLNGFEKLGLIQHYGPGIIGAYRFTSEALQKEAGSLVEGLVEVQAAGIEVMGEKAGNYLKKFEDEHGVDGLGFMVPLAREGIQLYLDGIDAGHYDTESMKQYFKSITGNNKRAGYFGEYYFDDNGDAIGLEYVMQKVVDGKGVVIE